MEMKTTVQIVKEQQDRSQWGNNEQLFNKKQWVSVDDMIEDVDKLIDTKTDQDGCQYVLFNKLLEFNKKLSGLL